MTMTETTPGPAIELDRILNVIEASTADVTAKIAAAERLAAVVRAQGLAFDTTAARKVKAVRELRNRVFAAGDVDTAEQIDRALGDEPVTPQMADAQRSIAKELMAAKSRIGELEAANILPAVMRLVAERKRQIAGEGWTPAHDDEHTAGQLADAAACYALAAANVSFSGAAAPASPPGHWPFDDAWWKPDTAIRMLEKAGAMIVAELERLERL